MQFLDKVYWSVSTIWPSDQNFPNEQCKMTQNHELVKDSFKVQN